MTQALRPALTWLLPALAAALLLGLLLARTAPAVPMTPGIELPGIGITPTAAPAAPVEPLDAAPVIQDTTTTPTKPETVTPPLQPAAPAQATPAPGAVPGQALPKRQEDPRPYPNLPDVKGPVGQ